MRPLNHFIVHLPNKFKDTIKVGDKELYLASKFNEFENRNTYGTIVGVPERHDTGAKIGDTLYFHHHVVMNTSLMIGDDKYIVMYDPEGEYANHALAYKDSDGAVHPLGDWVFLLKPERKQDTKGELAYDSEGTRELGLKAGDIVGFSKNSDYEIDVDGIAMYRMLLRDLVYVEEK
jgi:hypothetical protein